MENFIEKWKSRGNEQADYQIFWNDLIRDSCGIENPDSVMKFQIPVKFKDSTAFVDAWIPATRILIEQKSRGKKLDAPERQSDGAFLTPYEQAKRYDNARAVDQKANWIITSNFDEIWIYNMRFERPERHVLKIPLEEIPDRDLRFLVDADRAEAFSEEQISEAAGDLVQSFRDPFLDAIDQKNPDQVLALNKLCIRLVFCLYSEDTGIFEKSLFLDYLEETRRFDSVPIFKLRLAQLFITLSTPIEERHIMTEILLRRFPYVDGELFKDDPTNALDSLAFFDSLDENFDMRATLDKIIDASRYFNWKPISPVIFGAIFESIMNPDNRREDGVHFTSPENIHRAIDPLFLDDLNSEFETCEDLEKFHDKIANLKFLDPACGSGNFLTETYISLRKLEDRILKKIDGKIKVTIENFFGIEINDWAVNVAKLALWISESQMNGIETFLPLKKNANIVEANSLEIDWKSVIPNADFVMGNPPYVGYSMQSPRQKSEIRKIFSDNRNAGKMDYVCAWFKKASEYIRDSRSEVAFVSTNSICQGEHVGFLWKDLLDDGIVINFAHRSFKWNNESPDRKHVAKVYCIVTGLSRFNRNQKWIFENGEKISANQINGYLLDAPIICVERYEKSLCEVPRIIRGNLPRDGGNLIIEAEDLEKFLEKDPRAKKFIRPFMMGEEFINNLPRYCLWLVDAEPNEMRSIKTIRDRVVACKKFRLSSKAEPTQAAAKTPWLFGQVIQPTDGNFIAIPAVSTSKRKYLPIDFLTFETIVGNQLFIIPNGSLDLFGILTSKVHMTWIRTVAGRLGNGFRYATNVVYNTFPFPNLNAKQKSRIEVTAQKILDARSNHKNSSLADLYDPNFMPPDLIKAHEENDRAVIDAYGFPKNISESEIVARLFEMYQNLIQNFS
ncbi:MAG: N-6 DNA methylase [Selenomonadaceae bacterium]|nr:N-6 DNA methylase [Selenomonadaceae bacterium]